MTVSRSNTGGRAYLERVSYLASASEVATDTIKSWPIQVT